MLDSPSARYGSNVGSDSSTHEASPVEENDGGALRPITFGADQVSKRHYSETFEQSLLKQLLVIPLEVLIL